MRKDICQGRDSDDGSPEPGEWTGQSTGEASSGEFLKNVTSKTYVTKANKIEELRVYVAVGEFSKL